jgi:hypothetical protein
VAAEHRHDAVVKALLSTGKVDALKEKTSIPVANEPVVYPSMKGYELSTSTKDEPSSLESIRIAVARTGGLAVLIAHSIRRGTNHSVVLMSRAVSHHET